MTGRWAMRLSEMKPARLGSLRLAPGIEVLVQEETIWLYGTAAPDEWLAAVLRTFPGERFTVTEDSQLVPVGARVPRSYLPEGPWMPLSEWLGVQLPPLAYAAEVSGRVRLRLVRGGLPSEANVLLTTHARWRSYASGAPQIRLQGLRFAASGDEVIVQGAPLPPIRGLRLVAHQGIAVPAGWTWSPAVDPSVLRAMLAIAAGDLAIWRNGDRWTHVRNQDFVRATRSAARLLAQGYADA